MSVACQLGLQAQTQRPGRRGGAATAGLGDDPDVTDRSLLLRVAAERWPSWRQSHPVLADVDAVAGLRQWVATLDPATADAALAALAEVSCPQGGDDVAATAVLAWLMVPGASRLAWQLSGLSPRIDELVAAQLWVQARTIGARRGHRVAATMLWNTRREVLRDLGVAHLDPTWARTLVVEHLDLLTATGRGPRPGRRGACRCRAVAGGGPRPAARRRRVRAAAARDPVPGLRPGRDHPGRPGPARGVGRIHARRGHTRRSRTGRVDGRPGGRRRRGPPRDVLPDGATPRGRRPGRDAVGCRGLDGAGGPRARRGVRRMSVLEGGLRGPCRLLRGSEVMTMTDQLPPAAATSGAADHDPDGHDPTPLVGLSDVAGSEGRVLADLRGCLDRWRQVEAANAAPRRPGHGERRAAPQPAHRPPPADRLPRWWAVTAVETTQIPRPHGPRRGAVCVDELQRAWRAVQEGRFRARPTHLEQAPPTDPSDVHVPRTVRAGRSGGPGSRPGGWSRSWGAPGRSARPRWPWRSPRPSSGDPPGWWSAARRPGPGWSAQRPPSSARPVRDGCAAAAGRS